MKPERRPLVVAAQLEAAELRLRIGVAVDLHLVDAPAELALATWPAGVRPKIHFSSPKTAVEERKKKVGRRVVRQLVLPQLRAHADVIDPIAFEAFVTETAAGLDFDVMLEAKAKDVALLALRRAAGEARTTTPGRRGTA